MKVEIQTTGDGSSTLYREDMDEHYHSVKGALAESRHIYIDLAWREAAGRKSSVKVFEIGFGTGLNAALTAREALKSKIPTIYYSVELYPLPSDLIDSLIPMQDNDYRGEFIAVNKAIWDEEVKINPFFILRKIHGSLLDIDIPIEPDAVYFDAFAPEKQPEMWEEAIFRKIFVAMSSGGLLTTYCAKGVIRRMLRQIGFTTERLPGPPGGKREVLRGSKTDL